MLYFISALAFSQHDTVEFSVISVFLTSFLCDFGVEGFLWNPKCRLSPVVRSPCDFKLQSGKDYHITQCKTEYLILPFTSYRVLNRNYKTSHSIVV